MSQQFLKTTSGRTLVLPSAQEDAVIHAAMAADPDTREWLAADFAEAQPATGVGWQTRIDAALKDWLKNQSPV